MYKAVGHNGSLYIMIMITTVSFFFVPLRNCYISVNDVTLFLQIYSRPFLCSILVMLFLHSCESLWDN